MQNYFLAKHAFVCAIGQHVIVLDLRHDKYLAFEREFWDPIAKLIGGWPPAAEDGQYAHAGQDQAPDASALEQLMESGLLTEDSRQGKDASPPTIAPASSSLMEDFRAGRPAIRAGHVLAFLGAICKTVVRLRFQALEKTAARLSRQRQQSPGQPELAQMSDLTEIFRRLRPLLFASRDHCLFESLTLLHFLSHYGIHPTWVFGVQASPFMAHCWLQQDQTVCNDTLDHVHSFTPIMLI